MVIIFAALSEDSRRCMYHMIFIDSIYYFYLLDSIALKFYGYFLVEVRQNKVQK